MLLQVPAMPPVKVIFTEVDLPRYAMPDWWVAGGTVALAIITGFLAWYTYGLFKATKDARADSLRALQVAERNADAAHKSAQAAADGVRIARESMHRTLRAYLMLEKPSLYTEREFPDSTQVSFNTRNLGQTPAINVRIYVAFRYREDYPLRLDISASEYVISEFAILAKEQTAGFSYSYRISRKERTDKSMLLLYGGIRYFDTFSSEEHLLDFTYKFNEQENSYATVGPMNSVS